VNILLNIFDLGKYSLLVMIEEG